MKIISILLSFVVEFILEKLKINQMKQCKYSKEIISKLLSKKDDKMALSQQTINESEMAKNYVMNSDLDEDYKSTLVDLINTSLIATNGISPEEKIQKMTNSIQKLAISQVGLIKSIKDIMKQSMKEFNDGIDQKIKEAIKEANESKCQNCRALEHAHEVDKEAERKRVIEEFMRTSGLTVKGSGDFEITQTTEDSSDNDGQTKKGKKTKLDLTTIVSKVFELLEKPYVYIFLSIAVISPYGLEIIKLLLQYFGK